MARRRKTLRIGRAGINRFTSIVTGRQDLLQFSWCWIDGKRDTPELKIPDGEPRRKHTTGVTAAGHEVPGRRDGLSTAQGSAPIVREPGHWACRVAAEESAAEG